MQFCLGFLCGIFVALLVLGSYCSHENYRERAAIMERNSEISFKVPVNSFLETIDAEIYIM